VLSLRQRWATNALREAGYLLLVAVSVVLLVLSDLVQRQLRSRFSAPLFPASLYTTLGMVSRGFYAEGNGSLVSPAR